MYRLQFSIGWWRFFCSLCFKGARVVKTLFVISLNGQLSEKWMIFRERERERAIECNGKWFLGQSLIRTKCTYSLGSGHYISFTVFVFELDPFRPCFKYCTADWNHKYKRYSTNNIPQEIFFSCFLAAVVTFLFSFTWWLTPLMQHGIDGAAACPQCFWTSLTPAWIRNTNTERWYRHTVTPGRIQAPRALKGSVHTLWTFGYKNK